MDIDKTKFESIISDVKYSFNDLDINKDGIINEQDKNASIDNAVKQAIEKVLNSVDENCEITEESLYKGLYNELKEISDNKNYDINGDGKINFQDIVILKEKYDYDKNFGEKNSVIKEKFGDGMGGNIYNPNTEKTYANGANILINRIINSIKKQNMAEFDSKIDTTTSRNTGEGLGVSDLLEAYDEMMLLPDDLFEDAFKAFKTKLDKITKLFEKTSNSLEASDQEISRIRQIYKNLSSADSEILKKCKKNIPLYKNKTDENAIKLLSTNNFQGLGELNTIIKNIEKNLDIVETISSQLIDGDIPEGKSITFSIYVGDDSDFKYLSANNGYLTYTIFKKDGKYVYSFDNRWETEPMPNGYYKAGGGKVNITDEQMDTVLKVIGDNKAWGNMYKNGGTSLDIALNAKIDEALSAEACNGKDSGDRSFINEFGQISEIIKCLQCGGATTSYLSIFTQIEKICDLFDYAKKSSSLQKTKKDVAANNAENLNNKTTEVLSDTDRSNNQKVYLANIMQIIKNEEEKELEKLKKKYDEIINKINNADKNEDIDELIKEAEKIKNQIHEKTINTII